ncbi:leucine-rich repeat serine/threonine-protein kinase 1-like [Babylonia areolata]|uniref:leucine-rich repeat serine/threonine-protein kinase 1-like n=1 Tax=Babylonia areolata TaxID=304850 RepID=UPI003FCFA766
MGSADGGRENNMSASSPSVVPDLQTRLQLAVSQANEKGFCELLETCDADALGECVSRDPSLFGQICGGGFSSAVNFLLRNCETYIDLLAEFDGRTGLQWACLRGYSDVVGCLLAAYKAKGLSLQAEAWQEHSEFYSASLGGHVDVMKSLMLNFPEVVKDADVCQAMLYAACVGGHLPMVHIWLTPNVDVNKPLSLVSSLHDCENRTPFHAACEGHHEEVAVVLMKDFNAEVTRHLADKLPDFVRKLVERVYQPLRISPEQVKYDLSSTSTHMIEPSWIQPDLSAITDVDLSHNKLRALPACLPWAMRSLVKLDVSHNQLRTFPMPECQDDIVCDKLEKVNASHNRIMEPCVELFQRPSLVHLDLSHNALGRLTKGQPLPAPPGMARLTWSCESLTTLNLSHNALDLLPPDEFKVCKVLTTLDLSHNQLCCIPPPWDCKLERLNVSHNQLERFPPSTEQFWNGSLTHMYLNNNCVDQLNENVFKLGSLQKLNASHNKIQYLAPPRVWDCPSLEELNLSHNCLGQAQLRRASEETLGTTRGGDHLPQGVEIPSDLLEELRGLDLSDNGLIHVPISVCYVKNLAMLDLRNNPIRELPTEMGNLGSCWDLKLKGLNLQRAEQQEIVKNGKPLEVIDHLRKKLRKAQPCHTLKVLVVGPQNKGKSTVIESLVRSNMNKVKPSQQYVSVTSTTLKAPGGLKIPERTNNDRPVITLHIWELAGSPEFVSLHPLLWSENSLFLLVWDMNEDVSGLSHWLSNIRSRLSRVSVIIAATFRDRIPAAEVNGRVLQFHRDVSTMYGEKGERSMGLYPKEDEQKIYPHLCSVVFVTRQMLKQDVVELRRAVYSSALSLVKFVRPLEFIVGQLVPHSYLLIEEKMRKMAEKFWQEGRPPYLTQQEFDDLLHSDPAADFHIFEDQQEALKVWSPMGSVLHYDVWAEGLGQMYFLDPNWLASMAMLVLMPGPGVSVPHRQSLRDVQQRLGMAGYPGNLFRPLLQLLKYFDVGATLSDNESLLLPCLLPKTAPGLELPASSQGQKFLRFYAMPHVPCRLWSRLILGFLMSMDRFSQSYWQGVEIKKPQLTYWQEGLTIKYCRGSIVIKSAVFLPSEDSARRPGILVSILTDSPTLSDTAVTGFVTDEIDSALQTIFPHYQENTNLFGAYALCPVCFHDLDPSTDIVRGSHLHFALPDCAGDLLCDDYALCGRGNRVALEDLIPEFLMGELPERLHFHSDEVQLKERLGGGAAGTVYKGILLGEAVAVKEFYRNTDTPPAPTEDGAQSDSGTSTMSSTASSVASSADSGSFTGGRSALYGNFQEMSSQVLQRRQDHLTGRNLKVCRAFSELRQEVVILSQLHHPCLISLLGVSIRPSLLVVLELAPLGSLRSVLDEHLKERPFNRFRDRERTFGSMLNKDITFKVVYQVALGLDYLHKRRILYRDLKSDNILVCSLAPEDSINVKISDYGISKFTTSQGLMGMVGTPGYMAPEIMDGQAYNEKVDIFSFSMVVYELLTGHPPFEKYSRLHQLHQVINTERCRPSLMEYNVIASFPYLESLMERMWAHDPRERPSAAAILHQMEDVGFLLQHSHLATSSASDTGERPFCNVTCVWAINEISRASSALGRNICWVWESPSSSCLMDRGLYIYNLASGRLQRPRKRSPGAPVTCMAQIGQHRWVGSKEVSDKPQVNIFPIPCVDSAKGMMKLGDLEADPVAIIQDRDNPNKDKLNTGSEGLVYVGMSNGTIQIYRHQTKRTELTSRFRNMPKEWHPYKTLTLAAPTMQAMCLAPEQRELVAACGHSIVIVSTDTLLCEQSICTVKHLPISARDKAESIADMVSNEHTLWCSFENSPLIMEFEMRSWRVARAYCIEADLEVYITEVRLTSWVGAEGECRACRRTSSCVSRHFPRPGGHGGSEGSARESDASCPPPPPRPPSATKPGRSGSQNDDPDEAGVREEEVFDPEQVQMRHKRPPMRCRSADRSENPSGVPERIASEDSLDDNRASNLLSVKQTGRNTNRNFSVHGEEAFSGIAEIGVWRVRSEHSAELHATAVPPVLNKEKSRTQPNLSTINSPPSTPPPPPRRSLPSDYDGVHIQSILCVKNTLWIGSSCGEILVIGVEDTGGESSPSSQSHPPVSPTHRRMSLSLDTKQICNLVSVRMSGADNDKRSGGVHTLVQARDLVVAVRNFSQTAGQAEIAVWEACSAERLTSVRRFWQLLAGVDGSRA